MTEWDLWNESPIPGSQYYGMLYLIRMLTALTPNFRERSADYLKVKVMDLYCANVVGPPKIFSKLISWLWHLEKNVLKGYI